MFGVPPWVLRLRVKGVNSRVEGSRIQGSKFRVRVLEF